MRTLLLALAMTGCAWPEEDVVLFEERFEEGLARWSVSGGVTTVETVHPGEHGVIFDGGTYMSTTFSATVWDEYSDGLWIEYSTTCPGQPRVTDYGTDIWLELPTSSADRTLDGSFERVHLNLPPGQIGTTYTWLYVVASGTSSADCVLDNLRLMQPQVDYAY